jgi:hypothetical protein
VGSPSTERIRTNNKRFREANETINGRAEELGADMQRLPFLCECPAEDCVEILRLTRAEYAAIREHGDRFMTAVGHAEAELPIGQVVARHNGYVVVEKKM